MKDELKELYEDFLMRHPRANMTENEKNMRLLIFKRSVKDIEEKNAQSNYTKYGITMFADWTENELEAFSRPLQSGKERVFRGPGDGIWTYVRWNGVTYIPPYFDWRWYHGVTPVKRQNSQCNSCWAHAVTGTVEALYKIRYGRTAILSELEMVDCDYTNSGCISGSTRRATARGYSHGFYEQHQYVRTGWCYNRGTIRLKRLYTISPDENSIAWFISHYGPVTLNVAVPLFLYKDFKGGIMMPTYYCSTMTPNHAVTAVGYGIQNGIKYWILKNSWGTDWGENGYFRMQRGVGACWIESFPTSASFF